MENASGGEPTTGPLGAAGEALRSAVVRLPIRPGGGHRVSRILGGLLSIGSTDEVEARVGGGVRFPFLREDLRHKAFWGLFETGVRAVLRETLRPGAVFLDLGAHRGFHSAYGLALVGPEGLVIAVEPLPGNLARLRRLAEVNPRHRLVVVGAAVARTTGEADLIVADHSMLCSIDHRPARKFSVVGTVRVPTLSLDDLWDRHVRGPANGRPVVLKMDIEGAEDAALLGGPRTLAETGTLRSMVLECAGGRRPRSEERATTVVRILREAGFDIRVLTAAGGPREWNEGDLRDGVYIVARR